MAEQRSTIEFTVDGLSIAALTAGPADPAAGPGKPLIAALHGGTYIARYFDVAGSPQGTFMDLAASDRSPWCFFDRPGYGASAALDPAENTFDRHARLLAGAIAQAAARFPADGVGQLAGHHILGHALHLRQLAFAEECQLWASQPS